MKNFSLIASCVLALLLMSCSTSTDPINTPPQVEKLLVSSITQDGITAELYSVKGLVSGYNPLYVRLLKSGKVVLDAHVQVHCDMDMGSLHHGSPVVQPEEDPDENGIWNCGVVFTMPSATKWSVVLSIHDHESDQELEIRMPVSVSESNDVQTTESSTYGNVVVAMDHAAWHTGLNDFRILMFTTSDSVSYTPVENAVITVHPTMPSMGHGSSGNKNPVSTGEGLYNTTVNLIMSGEWDIAFEIKNNDGASSAIHFPILVP